MKKGTVKIARSRGFRRAVGSIVTAIALGGCLTAGAAFADTSSTSDTLDAASAAEALNLTSGLPTFMQSGLFSDQETVSAMSTLSRTAYPSTLDLRHYNGTVTYDADAGKSVITGGINYVTPVKQQYPFNDCWAFSICASAETSLLTSLDKADDGELNGTVDYEKAASGEAGSIAYAASDISERALAYSIFTYPKSYGMYSSQAGEGSYLVSGVMGDGASIINVGGMPYSGVSTFSCAIGPTPEYASPYISDEGWIEVKTPDGITHSGLTIQYQCKYFTNLAQAIKFWDETWTDEVLADFNEKYSVILGTKTKDDMKPARASVGTWSVESDKIYGSIAELSESNILETTKGDGLSSDEIAAMKQELLEGRAISIAFKADQSTASQTTATTSYMNYDNWAQYTYEEQSVNHGVTIVGYDDDYAASNFTHNLYKTDPTTGELVVDEEKTALTTPEGNGAWIVKNSWGSADSENYLDQSNWGIDGSGYFYLSYYDKNISSMESYAFDTSQEAQERSSYATAQYDVSKANQVNSLSTSTKTQTCNVFDGPNEGENPVAIRDLGCVTGAVDDNVTLDIYVMDEDADPATIIAQGNPTATVSAFYEKSGYHRIHLDDAVVLGSGKKVAVVQTTRRINGSYEYSCLRGNSKDLVEEYNKTNTSTVLPIMSSTLSSYVYTVVNEGESLIYIDGAWKDWTEQIKVLDAADTKDMNDSAVEQAKKYQAMADAQPEGTPMQKFLQEFADNWSNFHADHASVYDNFSIKLYGDRTEAFAITEQPQSAAAQAGDTVTMSVSTTGKVKSYQWQHSKDGVTWNNTKWAGYDTSEFSFKMLTALDARQWRCVVTFADGTQIISDAATTSLPTATGTITAQPQDATAAAGSKVTMSVTTTGTVTSYQWQHSKDGVTWNNTKWAGYDTSEFSFKMLTALDARQWRCVVTFADGHTEASQAATTTLA